MNTQLIPIHPFHVLLFIEPQFIFTKSHPFFFLIQSTALHDKHLFFFFLYFLHPRLNFNIFFSSFLKMKMNSSACRSLGTRMNKKSFFFFFFCIRYTRINNGNEYNLRLDVQKLTAGHK